MSAPPESGPRGAGGGRWRVWPLVLAVVVGLAVRTLGMTASDAVLIAVVTLVLALVRVTADAGRSYPWPVARPVEAPGTRREISALSWSFIGREGRVSEAAVRRLREVAARRLARHGVVVPLDLGAQHAPPPERAADLDRARAMLGERAWRALRTTGGLPSLGDISHCVDVLERLAPGAPGEEPAAGLAADDGHDVERTRP